MGNVLNLTGGTYYPDGDKIKFNKTTPGTNKNIKTNEKNYKDIAGAINLKNKKNISYTPAEMAKEIENITTLKDGTEDANALAEEIFQNKTAYAKGEKVIGNFTIQPELNTQRTDIDNLITNLNKKIEIASQAKPEQEKKAIPSKIRQEIVPDQGKTLSKVIIEPAELGIDTSDATAVASDLMLNKTAYAKDQKITGSFTIRQELDTQKQDINNAKSTLTNKATNPTPKVEQEKEVTITTNTNQVIIPDSGKVLSKVIINVNIPTWDGGGSY